MPSIFISYRRDDSADFCDRIADYLGRQFGAQAVFRDINTILAGSNFVTALNDALMQCRVLLVVIGPNWLSARDANGQYRLDQPNDFVRYEIATALQSGKRVVPVLVGGATLPQASELPADLAPLTKCPSFVIRSDPYFADDMAAVTRPFRHLARWRPSSIGVWIGALGSTIGVLYSAIVALSGTPQSTNATLFYIILTYLFSLPALIFAFVRSWRTHQWRWMTSLGAFLGMYVLSIAILIITNTLILLPQVNTIFAVIILLIVISINGMLFGFGAIGPRRPAKNIATERRPTAPFIFVTALMGSILFTVNYISFGFPYSAPRDFIFINSLLSAGILLLIASVLVGISTLRAHQWVWLGVLSGLWVIGTASIITAIFTIEINKIASDVMFLIFFLALIALLWLLVRFGWRGAIRRTHSTKKEQRTTNADLS